MSGPLLKLLAALAALCILTSCATITHPSSGRVPVKTSTEIICGNLSLLVPDYLEGCPDGSGACTSFDGVDYVLQYPSNDPALLAHEKEHACGMRHREPWVRTGFAGLGGSCAEVTAGGQTPWVPGDVMCRSLFGGFLKETNRSKIDLVRHLQNPKSLPGSGIAKEDPVAAPSTPIPL